MTSQKQLRKELKDLNINDAVAEPMMSHGHEAYMLRWNGEEEIFTGIDYGTADEPFTEVPINEQKLAWMADWADENLDRN